MAVNDADEKSDTWLKNHMPKVSVAELVVVDRGNQRRVCFVCLLYDGYVVRQWRWNKSEESRQPVPSDEISAQRQR